MTDTNGKALNTMDVTKMPDIIIVEIVVKLLEPQQYLCPSLRGKLQIVFEYSDQ